MTFRSRRAAWIVGGVAATLGALVLGRAARDLARTRPAVAAFARIVAAGNAGDLATARGLCTASYQARHPIEAAPGGGVAGIPRQIHPNFRVWPEGDEVRLCPGNRVGTVYRFVREGDAWRLDGVAGLLGTDGRVAPIDPGDGADAPRAENP